MSEICEKYCQFLLIIGIVLVLAGVLITPQGSPRIRESTYEDIQEGTTEYTYEVPGQIHILGISLVLLGAVTDGVGMGWLLWNTKENKISSNLRWINITSLITGLMIASLGFYLAVTNDMQTIYREAIPFIFNLAVEQIIGIAYLASGFIIIIPAVYVLSTFNSYNINHKE